MYMIVFKMLVNFSMFKNMHVSNLIITYFNRGLANGFLTVSLITKMNLHWCRCVLSHHNLYKEEVLLAVATWKMALNRILEHIHC